MIKIFTDSSCSIKNDEKEALGIEILPLKVMLEGKEYSDGVDISHDLFYDKLINHKQFPKTSLPSIGDTEKAVKKYTDMGYDVMIITISSGISGTYNALKLTFEDNERVRVLDSKCAVGGIRLIVEEALRYTDTDLDTLEEKLKSFIPRIKVAAIPETLEYLHRGGRLSHSSFIAGTLLNIKPIITLDTSDGKVKVIGKELGKHRAMCTLVKMLSKYNCDEKHGIVASYTYSRKNLDELIALTDERYKNAITAYDDLSFAIAAHWGPNAFGYIFVTKE